MPNTASRPARAHARKSTIDSPTARARKLRQQVDVCAKAITTTLLSRIGRDLRYVDRLPIRDMKMFLSDIHLLLKELKQLNA